MSNLRRMLSRAMRTSPWDDSKKDREWGQTKRRQRRAEQRETEELAIEATTPEPRILQHLDDGSPCPGAHCEKCLLDWILKGEVYFRIVDDPSDGE